ncbi:formate dehydrogenase gamma subunit [Symbiobacterium terraclitae]|uniref:Formate dehydrogenase gamma subunit n=1 Tax=Symbiobacterium terraclitae TaxID=557451 RepID=A0ABS4JUC4_9FIRM|nr:cytochrome b/b6 domain-containing protein [Symbiobacterium terraclitae]MBP2019138.1 formate dehydrogenase gamma subunit [Symbiobacterium terraclitae]
MARRPQVRRHTLSDRVVHWGVALSIFLLIFSGIGQMPMYKRYKVADLPGMAWSADYGTTLRLHYIGAAILIGVAAYHILFNLRTGRLGLLPRRGDLKESVQIIAAMLTGRPEPPSGKFLAEQRLAYAFIAGTTLLLILTGLVKVIKNLPGVTLPYVLLKWNTALHNIGTGLIILGIAAHLAAFLLRPNRPLVKSIFTGTVDAEYARHRHPLWNPPPAE